MKRLVVVAASVAMLVGPGASAAFAGEVKGPPNQLDNTNETGALDHANSACAASGLNDFDSPDPRDRWCRRCRLRRTLGSTTGFRRVPQARSDSAGAEPGRGKTRVGPGVSAGAKLLLHAGPEHHRRSGSRTTLRGGFRFRLSGAAFAAHRAPNGRPCPGLLLLLLLCQEVDGWGVFPAPGGARAAAARCGGRGGA